MNILRDYDQRSPIVAINGICATSQPLASQVGIDILKSGGNAADAAIAMAATLSLTEPFSTGLGGDCVVMFWNNKTKEISSINGIGRSPMNLTIDSLESKDKFGDQFHTKSVHAVTVPGAAAAWCDTIKQYGSGDLTLSQIFQPTIDYCEQGVPIQVKTSYNWKYSSRLKPDNANELLCDGKKPEIGDTLTNVPLSNCLKLIAKHGKDGFYKGEVADSIIKAIQDHGGLMTHADLESHKSTYDKPISINYRGYQIYELPPTSQGITSLMALNILEGFEMNKYEPISDQHTHLLIESMRLSYADAFSFVSDPEFATIPIDELLSKDYAASRRSLINEYKANDNIQNGYPLNSSNTVCASVVDKDGNVCCLFNSIFMEFGSGIIPKGCGFALQNRGCWFNLDRNHPNCLQPGKRPYHTVMPTMILDKDGEFYASIGIIGGIIQPVANVQAIVNLIDHKMDPQTILNFPRFRIENSPRYGLIDYESDFENTFKSMKERGHNIGSILEARIHFGWGQIIVVKKNNQNQTVLIAGSDNRSDGIAIGY